METVRLTTDRKAEQPNEYGECFPSEAAIFIDFGSLGGRADKVLGVFVMQIVRLAFLDRTRPTHNLRSSWSRSPK